MYCLLLPYLQPNSAAYVESARRTGLKNSTIRKGKFCLVFQIRRRKLPFTSFPIHYSLIILLLDTMYSQLLTASPNRQQINGSTASTQFNITKSHMFSNICKQEVVPWLLLTFSLITKLNLTVATVSYKYSFSCTPPSLTSVTH